VLALGGGGARGFAHIGVLEVLEQAGLPLAAVVGTSMGAAVGGMFLASGSAAAVEDRWRQAREQDLIPRVGRLDRLPEAETHEHPLVQFARRVRDRVVVSMAVNRSTMLDGRDLDQAFEYLIPDVGIETLPLPFAAVATDLAAGEEVLLRRGKLRDAVRASSSIPGVLPAVELDGRVLVDGGVLAEVPLAAARSFGRPVVAVDVSMDLPAYVEGGLVLDTMMRTQLMTSTLLRRRQLDGCRRLIRPAVGHATWADWGRFDELVEAGRVATRSFLGLPGPTAPQDGAP
jgi:NTE family protein